MNAQPEHALGARVGEHPTDNARRRTAVVWSLLVGVVGVAAGIPILLATFDRDDTSTGSNVLPGAVLGIGLLGLGFGLTRLVALVRGRGEMFVLYQGGLVHQRLGRRRVIGWPDIASVRQKGPRPPLAYALGNDVDLRVRLRDGGRLRVTGYTRNAQELAQALAQAAPGARG
ncbi:hypothetical protein FH609_013905 [Streptomyces sp. 3MP-14]|uniref:Low molecular weight protein antigen 6 PH domain-containing protein n=1 Tax=Streptomyces mimosae TaxID=2586635 RepID=A0A5N6A954_9ACTN|nr:MULTISPECIES: PH domain-containing protein [Streptomyces]KAB8164290.1 hypothetical protein FH607_016795 [Streptomyces mimosae]KAB8176567.1 hypothetical protein FH609_013905 [Streptomyces sp. 3MP-14]